MVHVHSVPLISNCNRLNPGRNYNIALHQTGLVAPYIYVSWKLFTKDFLQQLPLESFATKFHKSQTLQQRLIAAIVVVVADRVGGKDSELEGGKTSSHPEALETPPLLHRRHVHRRSLLDVIANTSFFVNL